MKGLTGFPAVLPRTRRASWSLQIMGGDLAAQWRFSTSASSLCLMQLIAWKGRFMTTSFHWDREVASIVRRCSLLMWIKIKHIHFLLITVELPSFCSRGDVLYFCGWFAAKTRFIFFLLLLPGTLWQRRGAWMLFAVCQHERREEKKAWPLTLPSRTCLWIMCAWDLFGMQHLVQAERKPKTLETQSLYIRVRGTLGGAERKRFDLNLTDRRKDVCWLLFDMCWHFFFFF